MAFWQAADKSLIYYETHGERRAPATLLLLPGLLGSVQEQWLAFVAPLAAGYHVLLIDLRGHGRSENRATALDPRQMAADLLGVLDEAGVDRCHIAGYSLGGYLGLMLHLSAPTRVKTVLMHATKFYWTKETAAAMRKQLDPDQMAAKAPAYANQLAVAHGANRWRSLVRQAADLVVGLSQDGLNETAVSLAHVPVLVSVGDRDDLVPVDEAQRVSRALPRGSLLVLPGVRHPFQTVGREPLLTVMRQFIDRND